MSNDYLSSLPEEMLEEISEFFDQYYTYSSYSALAQSCKSLRPYFQRRLFSNVELAAEIRIRTFAELVQVNPILASYIQTIDLEVDNMCMGLFQYPPMLAIMHAVSSSSGTLPEIQLDIGALLSYANELGDDIPSNTLTHILNAPQNILDAITYLRVTYSMEKAIPFSLFRLLSNLRIVSGYFLVYPISDTSSNNRSAEDLTPEFFRPKLDELSLDGSDPATITMLCEQILDLSVVKELRLFYTQLNRTSEAFLNNAKYFLAQRVLHCAQSVQKLTMDIGVMVGPFYDLSRLQRLRECTLDIAVEADNDPVPHLTQLLRTLPPLPEHDLKHLYITLKFTKIPPDTKYITISQVLFSLSTWSKFDAALDDVGASGTRPFELTLWFFTDAPTFGFVDIPSWLKDIFVDWERKYLPRSSQQQNLKINILHPYDY
ncbi:hypothetical protein BDN70DRAFT_997251 [Pholiota conissans]|uniref:F-box domain-containing protein n=1 Tax=Pholiota conissans TaxID=109636 RepID=A0A9P5YQN9_9AGAR|nr:hypothetical protein BDN70DRAFT_997251 [Pholiota conissans]